MSQAPSLQAQETFHSLNAQRHGSVDTLLGQGGQGAVYRVQFSGEIWALKWYHDHYIAVDQTLRERLGRTISRGAPDQRFLWPMELVQIPGRDSFGYVMALRPADYRCISDLLAAPPHRIVLSLEKRLSICWQIADSFLHLHAGGFCYQDINFGNFFIHPVTAQVLICDNDNVNVDGSDASIYGTRKFMAPEVVRRETLPNTRTDLFSMAVLFFYVLFGWHPLDGRRESSARVMNAELESQLYGSDPLFLFDQQDDSNGPDSPLHDAVVCRWRSLPISLRGLFLRAFGDGLLNPGGRIMERQWMAVLEQVRFATYDCPACRYEHVLDAAQPKAHQRCVYCGEPLDTPAYLLLGENVYVLAADRAIGQAQLGVSNAADWDSAALVVEHPRQAGVLGLRNMMDTAWAVCSARTPASTVAPGKTVMLVDGLEVDFGQYKGTIRHPANTEKVSLKDAIVQGEASE